jgi:RNA polymerase sigma-70 factor, ECF subfamily
MLEDLLLIWRLRAGDGDALARIYEIHRRNLLRIASGLLNHAGMAEDIVHDVFLQLAQAPGKVRLTGNLRSFLATCVVNRARNANRALRQRRTGDLEEASGVPEDGREPEGWIIASERFRKLNQALAQLPGEQREAVVLHLQTGMKFRAIARCQNVSINTAQSRYRYGLDKLRSLLDGEVL